MHPELSGPTIQDKGYSLDDIAAMARLGLVFKEIRQDEIDGNVGTRISFSFIPESPLGRANIIAGHDKLELKLLGVCIHDAKTLSYDEFKSQHPSLGPYETVNE